MFVVKKLTDYRGRVDFPGLADLEATKEQIRVHDQAIEGAESDPSLAGLKADLEAKKAELEAKKREIEKDMAAHEANEKPKRARFANFLTNTCRLVGCERSRRSYPNTNDPRRHNKPGINKSKNRRVERNSLFCDTHCGLKNAIPKDDLQRMTSNIYLRVEEIADAA